MVGSHTVRKSVQRPFRPPSLYAQSQKLTENEYFWFMPDGSFRAHLLLLVVIGAMRAACSPRSAQAAAGPRAALTMHVRRVARAAEKSILCKVKGITQLHS